MFIFLLASTGRGGRGAGLFSSTRVVVGSDWAVGARGGTLSRTDCNPG